MDQDKDAEWRALVERVGNVKESLRMFAITRGIRYAQLYEVSLMSQELGPLDNELSRADAPVHWWSFSHPHLFYRNFEANIREARFVQGKYNIAMAHTNENIYHPQQLMIPPERPKAWPKAWKWPTNPQCANEIPEQPPFGLCHWCNDIISCEVLSNQNPHCECKRDSYEETPLVEIRQFQNFERDPLMGINRGVVALSPIKTGDIIGEYVGTFTNRRNKAEKDNTYLFDFPGPLVQNEDLSWAPRVTPTCNLSAAEAGNWTRFINAGMDSTEENVEFQAQGIGGKLRIILKATKNIRFGEELLTNYGKEYFKLPKRKLDEDELDEDYFPSKKRRRTR